MHDDDLNSPALYCVLLSLLLVFVDVSGDVRLLPQKRGKEGKVSTFSISDHG